MTYSMCTNCLKKGKYCIPTPSCYGPANTYRCKYCGDVQQPQEANETPQDDSEGWIDPEVERMIQSEINWLREYYGVED